MDWRAPRDLVELARDIMGGDPAHGWPHVVRVALLARRIVEGEGLNPDWRILDAAILLHDTGRFLGGGHHAAASARLARLVLPGLGYGPGEVEAVEHAILAHSYSLGLEAETVEARVLSDADKLDALGAVGVARVFHTGCQLGRGFEDSIRHFHEKILRLPGLLYYGFSRRLAGERTAVVKSFLEAIERELGVMRLDEADPPPGGGGGGEVGRRH